MIEPATFTRVALPCSLSAPQMLELLSGEPLPFALTGRWAGGGAIVGADPVEVADDHADPLAVLDRLPRLLSHDDAPAGAIGGGWFGWLGYRLAARIERVSLNPVRPVPMPEFHLARYDNVLRLDRDRRWWFEALETDARRPELSARLRDLRRRIETASGRVRSLPRGPQRLCLDPAAAAHHLGAVQECRERIAAGEIFQANLCVRLDGDYDGTAAQLLALARRTIDPPWAAAFDTPNGSVASLSPELFLRRRGDLVRSAPIKGTARRAGEPAADAEALSALRASAKDASEHVMIVDLVRNDLGRVSEYGSVTTARIPAAEAHPGLWHLVSDVSGRLRPGTANAEVLRAAFPPGSVTGAPKVQALQVIAALEPTAREVYTGAIGYASPLAGLELNVAIRTLELRDGRLWLGAGGGIVADSDPGAELAEAIAKARPIAAAVGATVLAESPGFRIA